MKPNKLILENLNNTIDNFSTIQKHNLNESHPFVVEESGPRFIVVEEFSNEAKSLAGANLANQQNVENNANKVDLVYAEEIIDDDDDLYGDGLHDRAVEKARHRNYSEIAKEFDETIAENGFVGEVAFNLLSAMKFSRLLYIKNNDSLREQLKLLAATIGTPYFEITKSVGENIASSNDIYDVLGYAKKNINKPIFLNIGVQKPTEIFDFLKPIYSYIDNPEGDSFLVANGKSMIVPPNVFITYTIEDEKEIYNISRRLLRYSAKVEWELTRSKVDVTSIKPFILSLEELKASYREANEMYSVEEESWRKIDELLNAISSVNGYCIHNKIQRRLEDYLIILLSANKKIEDAIDIALSNNILTEAIITATPVKYFEEVNLIEKIDDTFGSASMKRSKVAINDYLSLFNKKGEKVNE